MKSFLGEVKGIFNVITLFELIVSLVFIVAGMLFITTSDLSAIATSIFTGLVIISSGVSSIYAYKNRGGIQLFNNNLLFGIALLITGVISLFVSKYLGIMLGIYFIISGLQRINYGRFLKRFNENAWLITLVTGIFFIIIGIISFFTSSDKVVNVAGICTLGYGTMNLVNFILLRHRSKYFIA